MTEIFGCELYVSESKEQTDARERAESQARQYKFGVIERRKKEDKLHDEMENAPRKMVEFYNTKRNTFSSLSERESSIEALTVPSKQQYAREYTESCERSYKWFLVDTFARKFRMKKLLGQYEQYTGDGH